MHFDSNGNLITLNHKQGLISINPKGVSTVLAATDENGHPFLIPNGLDIAEDGMIYFSNTSEFSAYNIKYGRKVIMEIFIDNLHGFPNGISIREDGSYWLGFSTKRSEALDKIHPKTGMKKFVYSLPEFMQPKAERFGMIMNISEEGEILSSLFDTNGEVLPEAGAVKEHNGYLYIGGDVIPYIAKYKL